MDLNRDHVEGETTINPRALECSREKAEITTYLAYTYIPGENRKREPRNKLAIINRVQRCATRVLLTDMVEAKKKEKKGRERKKKKKGRKFARTKNERIVENARGRPGVCRGFIGYVNAAKLRGSHPRDTVVHPKRMIFLYVRRVVTRRKDNFDRLLFPCDYP